MSAVITRITVAIDVDGVVCPFVDPDNTQHHERETGWSYTSYSGATFASVVADPLVQTLFDLSDGRGGSDGSDAAVSGIEVQWHTSWWLRASKHLAPALGLKGLCGGEERMFATRAEFLEKPSKVSSSAWWKLAAVERWLHEHSTSAAGEHELLIWIDDDIDGSIRSGEIPAELLGDTRLVMISPAIHTGMNPEELALLRSLTRLS